MQLAIFNNYDQASIRPPEGQLLKWIGNKQRFAAEIASNFPRGFRRYFEPFVGSGAVLATIAPRDGVAADVFPPLVEIWKALVERPAGRLPGGNVRGPRTGSDLLRPPVQLYPDDPLWRARLPTGRTLQRN